MNTQDLMRLLEQGEGVSVEYKTAKHSLPNNLFESICAFLNHNGGHILLGVKDDGTIEGIDADKVTELCKELSNLSNNPNKIDPPFLLQPQVFNIDDKNIISLFVPSSSQVHKTCGKVYDRSSDGDFILKSHLKLSELYLKKNNFYSENIIYPYLYESHFKPGLLNKVRNLIHSFHPGHPWLELSDSDFYKAAGLYRYDATNHVEGFTLAALLLLGTDEIIRSTLPYYRIEAIVRKENPERYDDRITVMCNLIDAHEQLMEFIRKHLPDTFFMEKDQRISIREKLFREIVANLLIHREYLNPSVSMITIEKDKVLAVNANKPLHYENFETYKYQSFPKNPTIALFFVQIGRAEFFGTGIRNIVKYAQLYSHSTPSFEDDNLFSVKIPLSIEEQVGEQVREYVGEQVREQVTKTIRQLLSVISGEHSVTELMNFLHLSGRRSFIENYIHPAIEEGLIEMSQPDSPKSPTQKYRLTDKGKKIQQITSQFSIDQREQVREYVGEQVREQVGEQVTKTIRQLLSVISGEHSVTELMNFLHLSGRRSFIENYIHPAIEEGLIEMSQPDSPKSPTQKYRLTGKGKQIQQIIIDNE